MNYIISASTDIGIAKDTNQDSLSMKVINTSIGRMSFAVLCDGMGGLSKGELASKEVIMAFSDWFDNVLIDDINNSGLDEERLVGQWNDIIQTQNQRLGEYGEKNNLMLGTTVSAILLYNEDYYIVHVGDSRVYCMTDKVVQLTKDQTFIAREIDKFCFGKTLKY